MKISEIAQSVFEYSRAGSEKIPSLPPVKMETPSGQTYPYYKKSYPAVPATGYLLSDIMQVPEQEQDRYSTKTHNPTMEPNKIQFDTYVNAPVSPKITIPSLKKLTGLYAIWHPNWKFLYVGEAADSIEKRLISHLGPIFQGYGEINHVTINKLPYAHQANVSKNRNHRLWAQSDYLAKQLPQIQQQITKTYQEYNKLKNTDVDSQQKQQVFSELQSLKTKYAQAQQAKIRADKLAAQGAVPPDRYDSLPNKPAVIPPEVDKNDPNFDITKHQITNKYGADPAYGRDYASVGGFRGMKHQLTKPDIVNLPHSERWKNLEQLRIYVWPIENPYESTEFLNQQVPLYQKQYGVDRDKALSEIQRQSKNVFAYDLGRQEIKLQELYHPSQSSEGGEYIDKPKTKNQWAFQYIKQRDGFEGDTSPGKVKIGKDDRIKNKLKDINSMLKSGKPNKKELKTQLIELQGEINNLIFRRKHDELMPVRADRESGTVSIVPYSKKIKDKLEQELDKLARTKKNSEKIKKLKNKINTLNGFLNKERELVFMLPKIRSSLLTQSVIDSQNNYQRLKKMLALIEELVNFDFTHKL